MMTRRERRQYVEQFLDSDACAACSLEDQLRIEAFASTRLGELMIARRMKRSKELDVDALAQLIAQMIQAILAIFEMLA